MVKNLFSKATHVTLGSIQPLHCNHLIHHIFEQIIAMYLHFTHKLSYLTKKKGHLHQYFFMHQITEKEEEIPHILQSE